MEGVEIVIKPKHIERTVFSLVIIVLAVLLIVKWDSGSCTSEDNLTGGSVSELSEPEQAEPETAAAEEETDPCENEIQDGEETDVDCGGPDCEPCDEFSSCNIDSDCLSGWCRNNIKCIEPSCEDGVKNQDESNVDCGGVCGGFFYDAECHEEPKPSYSGRVEISISDVETAVNDASGYAKVESVEFTVENGKEDDMILTAHVFARDDYGMPYYESSITGDEIAVATVDLPLLAQGESHSELVEIGRTLTETDPDDEYQIVVELRDDDDKLINSETWENN